MGPFCSITTPLGGSFLRYRNQVCRIQFATLSQHMSRCSERLSAEERPAHRSNLHGAFAWHETCAEQCGNVSIMDLKAEMCDCRHSAMTI